MPSVPARAAAALLLLAAAVLATNSAPPAAVVARQRGARSGCSTAADFYVRLRYVLLELIIELRP